MQFTNQYKLNLIETTDTFSSAPLNENMEKVEAAFLAQTDAMDVLSAGQLNCVTATYKGNGKYGESNPNTLTFEFEPKFVLIMGDTEFCLFARGASRGLGRCNYSTSSDRYVQSVTWNGSTMSWHIYKTYSDSSSYVVDASHQLNTDKEVYTYLAIG